MSRSPMGDFQREEVYRWERSFGTQFYGHHMKPRAAHRLARAMANAYAVQKPRLMRLRLGKSAYTGAAHADHTIEVNLDRAEFTSVLLAHEMAHVICHAYGIMEEDHGRTWLGVYLWLMDKFKIIPATASCPSARKAGLKFKRLSSVAPGEL